MRLKACQCLLLTGGDGIKVKADVCALRYLCACYCCGRMRWRWVAAYGGGCAQQCCMHSSAPYGGNPHHHLHSTASHTAGLVFSGPATIRKPHLISVERNHTVSHILFPWYVLTYPQVPPLSPESCT